MGSRKQKQLDAIVVVLFVVVVVVVMFIVVVIVAAVVVSLHLAVAIVVGVVGIIRAAVTTQVVFLLSDIWRSTAHVLVQECDQSSAPHRPPACIRQWTTLPTAG